MAPAGLQVLVKMGSSQLLESDLCHPNSVALGTLPDLCAVPFYSATNQQL